MHDFMAWLQFSALGHAMRDHGVWTYAVVNLCHVLGVASFFGAVLVLDLRLLGVGRRLAPLAALADAAVPVAICGLALAALSGAGLLATRATEYVGNPFLYIKFSAVALGATNAIVLQRSAAWRARGARELSARERRQLGWMGGMSLACWLTALGAGRLAAYW